MKAIFALALACAFASAHSSAIQAGKVDEAPISPLLSGSEYLDTEGKYLLAWNINSTEETIYFEVTAETTGYVGLGISPSGGMTAADILVAGVNSDGSLYFSDRHATGNMMPVEDAQQDWVVTFGEETETHTKLRFHRLMNTCDENDIRITDGTMRMIWALGQTDTLAYHGANKGTKSVNFYLKDEAEFEPEKFEKLDVTVTMDMPGQSTSYWCTIHRAPLFTAKQHIVAIEPVLESLASVQHTHHFTISRCVAPEGMDPEQLFDPWVNHEGDYCYEQRNESFPYTQYCNGNMLYVWSKGGKRLVFPDNLGLPIPEKLGSREYYSLEIHYDNPQVLQNVNFQTGGKIYYTPELREEEVGLLVISQEVQVQLTVPPQTPDFLVTGHCGAHCTREFFPEDGVTIFNNLFHAHLAGRKLKLRHFRGEEELPWVDVDEYYDFDFQQNKPLTNFRKVERGDQLTVECNYNSMTALNRGAVIGGLSTHDEMCQAIVYYYPKQEIFYCSSGQDLVKHMEMLGVTEFEVKNSPYPGGLPTFNILKPDHLAGDYLESVSFKVNWTQELRDRYQNEKIWGEQIGVCNTGGDDVETIVKYPDNLNVYVPPDDCQGA